MKIHKALLAFIPLVVLFACSSDESSDPQADSDSLLIGEWKRMNTEDQDGNLSDDTSTCNITEFTADQYIVTDYTDANCSEEFDSGSLPYLKEDDFIYFGEKSQDIKVEITELSKNTLKLKGEYSDNAGNQYYDVVTYSRM